MFRKKGVDRAVSVTTRFTAVLHQLFYTYNTRQKSWDTLHIFDLDKTFVPFLPLNNVGFWEKYMGYSKTFSCAIMPNVSGTDQHCFRGKGAYSRRSG